MRKEGHFKNYGVGQGGFYVGKINNEFTFVYDCGAIPIYQLKKAISLANYEFLQEKRIDMLVLSHFDIDHINGLKYLLESHYVESLYIPFVHPDILIFLKYLFISIGISMENIDNIYLVSSTTEREEGEFNNLDEYYSNTKAYIISDKKIIYFSDVWEFYFRELVVKELVVNDIKVKTEEIIEEIIKKCKDIEQNHESTNDSVKDLKNCFKKVFENEFTKNNFSNLISLFMYHKPIQNYVAYIQARTTASGKYGHHYCSRYSPYRNTATLLTGDGDLRQNKSDISNRFKTWADKLEIFNNLFLMDLPHHGSTNNIDECFFKEYFLKNRSDIITLSNSGLGNRYRHPNSLVVKLAINYSSEYISCSEHLSYEYWIKIC